MEKHERDLRDLVFGDDLAAASENDLQSISDRAARKEELTRLLNLRETLLTLADEEPPRRTVLVAPAPKSASAWWSSLFASPRWNFAGAVALGAALVFHAVWQPAPPVPPQMVVQNAPRNAPASSAPAAQASVEARVESLVNARMDAAIQQVRAELRAEHQAETQRLLAAAEERLEQRHDQEMYAMREAVSYFQKKYGRQLLATNAALNSEVQ